MFPILVVEVPPLVFVHGKTFGLHGAAEQIAMPALQGSAAEKRGKGARRHFVVQTWHFDGLTGSDVVESEIDRTAPIVFGAFLWIGDEDFAFGSRDVPEHFGDVPRAVGVVDEQAVAKRLKFVENADESFGGGTLHKGAGLGVDGRAEEVVGRGVANVEMEGRIERGEFDEVRLAEWTGFGGRMRGEGGGADFADGPGGSDVVEVRGIGTGIGAAVEVVEVG